MLGLIVGMVFIALLGAGLILFVMKRPWIRDWTRARRLRVGLLAWLLALTWLVLATERAGAQAYTNVYGPNFWQTCTNFPLTLTNGQTYSLLGLGQRFVMNPLRGLGFAGRVYGTNNCTGMVQFVCDASVDGTTNSQTTTGPLTLLVPLNNTLKKVAATNVPPTSTIPGINFRDYTITSIVNPHTNSIVVDAFWFTSANQ